MSIGDENGSAGPGASLRSSAPTLAVPHEAGEAPRTRAVRAGPHTSPARPLSSPPVAPARVGRSTAAQQHGNAPQNGEQAGVDDILLTLESGEAYAVHELEARLLDEMPALDSALVVGEGQAYVACLLSLRTSGRKGGKKLGKVAVAGVLGTRMNARLVRASLMFLSLSLSFSLSLSLSFSLSFSIFIYLCLWEDGYILLLQGSL